MSTERALWIVLPLLTLTLAACAATPSVPTRSFSEIRFGRPRPQAAPELPAPAPEARSVPPAAPVLRPALPAPAEPAPVLSTDLVQASSRVQDLLAHEGFATEQRPAAGGLRIEATRMGTPHALEAEAVCRLEALHRPDISSTDLTVDVTTAPGGVQVQSVARFVEIDTRLISGELTRQTCRSRGVLEAAVRRAAAGV